MMKKFALYLLLVSPLTFAIGEKTFTWIPPTEYDDATPLPQSDIAAYRIYCDGDTANPVRIQPNVPLDTDTWAALPGTFSVGSHSCFATTVTVEGEESIPSNTVNFIVPPGVPNPPIFAVQ